MAETTISSLVKVFPVTKESVKSDDEPEKPSVIVKEFCLNTTAHGLGGIARSRSLCSRLFWTIPTLGFLGVMIFFIVQAIIKYFNYPTQTSVQLLSQWPLSFPAVTVCNYGSVRSDEFLEPFLNYTNATEFSPDLASQIDPYLLHYGITTNFSSKLFFPLESMLISCSYNGIRCSADNFSSFSTREYGLCYTFNAKLKSVPNGGIRTTSDGTGGGIFKIEMYTHRHQYVPFVRRAVGVVATIHENDRMPNLMYRGLLLGAEQHHRWNFRYRSFSFQPAPYSQCSSQVSPAMRRLFDQYQTVDYRYSILLCFDICAQAYVFARCGCVSPLLWTIRSITLPGSDTIIDAELCNLTDPCWIAAGAKFESDPIVWGQFCVGCQEECSFMDFPVYTTSLPLMLDHELIRIKRFVEQSNITLPKNWEQSYATEIPKSYVALEIIAESARVENYAEEPTVGVVDLISDIGGQTGLWLGISFLSLFELIEMIGSLVVIGYRKLRGRLGHDQAKEIVRARF